MGRLMRKTQFLVIVVFGILIVSTLVVMNDPSITGREVLTQQLCVNQAECPEGKVCCIFYNKTAGVCGDINDCSSILNLTEKEKLPQVQLPINVNPWLFYAVILGILTCTIVIIVIFYRKEKE